MSGFSCHMCGNLLGTLPCGRCGWNGEKMDQVHVGLKFTSPEPEPTFINRHYRRKADRDARRREART